MSIGIKVLGCVFHSDLGKEWRVTLSTTQVKSLKILSWKMTKDVLNTI